MATDVVTVTTVLVCALAAVVEHLERVLKLRRHRYAQPLAGRQTVHQPFLVKRHQIVVGGELAEGALDHVGKLRLVLRNMMPYGS